MEVVSDMSTEFNDEKRMFVKFKFMDDSLALFKFCQHFFEGCQNLYRFSIFFRKCHAKLPLCRIYEFYRAA